MEQDFFERVKEASDKMDWEKNAAKDRQIEAERAEAEAYSAEQKPILINELTSAIETAVIAGNRSAEVIRDTKDEIVSMGIRSAMNGANIHFRFRGFSTRESYWDNSRVVEDGAYVYPASEWHFSLTVRW
jgi:hypothetical protein